MSPECDNHCWRGRCIRVEAAGQASVAHQVRPLTVPTQHAWQTMGISSSWPPSIPIDGLLSIVAKASSGLTMSAP